MEKISKATIRLWMPNKLIKFLKKNGALTSFIDEIQKENWHYRNSDLLKTSLLNKDPINWAFCWSSTKKGFEYWEKLNYKYMEEYGNDK